MTYETMCPRIKAIKSLNKRGNMAAGAMELKRSKKQLLIEVHYWRKCEPKEFSLAAPDSHLHLKYIK